MNVKRILLATLAYLVVTFPVAIVWHLVLFGPQYVALGYIEREEPIFAFGFLSILLQGAVMATMYAMLYGGRSTLKRALAFVGLFGLYHWTAHVLADAAKRDLSPLAMWFPLETAYLAVQFVLFGVLLAVVFRERAAWQEGTRATIVEDI